MKSKTFPYEALFEDKLAAVGQTVNLAAIDVALSDARDGFHQVEEILGQLRRINASDVGFWLDTVVNLKVQLAHIARHLTEVDKELQSLILLLQEHGGSSSTEG